MGTQTKKRKSRFFTSQGWPILFLGMVATFFMSFYIHQTTRDEDQLRFAYEADQAVKRIQYRMERYEGALIQARAFMLSSEVVSYKEFQEYFEKTKLIERYPGIVGLGFSKRIEPKDLKSHEREIQKEIPNYHVWPSYPRDFYFSIQYLAPENEKNAKAVGFDMFTEEKRREAMERAWVSGLPAMTGKIALVQGGDNESEPGFNFYVPFYKDHTSIDTVEDRLKNLIGFIYSPFNAEDLFEATFADVSLDLDLEIFDGKVMNEQSLIFDYDRVRRFNSSSDLKIIKEITIAGRAMTLHFVPALTFKHRYSFYFPLFAGFAGLLITFLIYRIFWITKRQAEQSHSSEVALQEAIQARDEFLSIASHELKTPLTSLKLQAQVTKRALEKDNATAVNPQKMKALVDQTERQTLRLERLVDDMLDISRIRTGRLTIEKEEFDLCELVRDIVSRMDEQFKALPGGCPKMTYCESAVGNWDKMRIEQVITNLLTNAIKYGDGSEVEVRISCTENKVILKVKDYGIGIAPEYQEKIFNRFERAGVSAHGISGLGLGLYITRQIVLSHKGQIWVESTPKQGATFIVELPRHA